MSRNSRIVPVLLVSTTIALGIAIILVSLHSNRLRMERETALAAAKYDGDALLKQLDEMPAASLDFLELDFGPHHPDLRQAREAWATWRQTFSSAVTFAKIVEWHRARLEPLGWVVDGGDDSDEAVFIKEDWSLTLIRLPDGGTPTSNQFQRQIRWQVTL